MKKRFILLAALLTLAPQCLTAQNQRITSMGGLSNAVPDKNYSLNLYDFGGNPAWLYADEQQSWLSMTPSFQNLSGDYRRKYDFETENLYGLGFTGVKTLGEKGTFLGYTRYSIDNRLKVNRNLKLDPYAGEAFFMADTMSGDFKYDGPSVGFMYSFKLLPKLYAGASVDYQVLKGLKSICSRAQTLYRNFGGSAGLAYAFTDSYVLGATVGFFDTQEAIEAKTDEGTNVEIFDYRGETYNIVNRAASVDEKIRKKGESFGIQLYSKPFNSLEIAVNAGYAESNSVILQSKTQIKEFESGMAVFKNYSLNCKTRYQVTPEILAAVSLFYSQNDSWSRNSERNLKLWDWNIQTSGAAVGASYMINSIGLLIAAEYQFSDNSADSSKYIDGVNSTVSSEDHLIKVGSEFRLTQKIMLRGGYNYGIKQRDLVYGGTDVNSHLATLGIGYRYSAEAEISISAVYGILSPNNINDLSRDQLGVQAEIKLLSF